MKPFRNPSKLIALQALVRRLRNSGRGKKIVFTNGCFDILHVGHVRYLNRARALGDVLVVGLNRDGSVRAQEKAPGRPLVGEKARAEVLSSLACVDHIVLFSDKTPVRLIQALRPDVLVKGADWKGKPIAGAELVRASGGVVKLVPLVKGFSTTALIKKIKKYS